MLSPSDIRPAVEAILRTTDSGLTTYEILDQLPAGLRHQIITERGMPGLGSGNSYSAASLVADAIEGLLPSLEPPYRVYVHGQAVFTVAGQEIRPGNSAIALYRLHPLLASKPLVAANEAKSSAPSPMPAMPVKKDWFEKPGMLVLWCVLFWPVFLVGMYYNGKAAIRKGHTPWYEETPWLVLSALFFPLFFVGLFSSRKVLPKWKWTIAGCFALFHGVFAMTQTPDKASSSTPDFNPSESTNVTAIESLPKPTPRPTAAQIKAKKEHEQRLALAQARAAREEKRRQEELEELARKKAEEERDEDGMVLMNKSLEGQKDGEYATISGVVENRTLRNWGYAQISFSLYDRDGNQCGSAMGNVLSVEAGARWRFKATGIGQGWQTYKFGSMTYR